MNKKYCFIMVFLCSLNHIILPNPTPTQSPEGIAFQEKLTKNNPTMELSKTDTVQQEINDLIKALQTIQENADNFAFSCDELATYHEKIYALKTQISTLHADNQKKLNIFRSAIGTYDQDKRNTIKISSQELIDLLDANFQKQLELHTTELRNFSKDYEAAVALHDTFITKYQTTLEKILPITQSVVYQDRAKRSASFDTTLANNVQPEALYESYKTFSPKSTITSSFSTDDTRSRYFNTVTINQKSGKLSFNKDFITKVSFFEQKLAGIRALLINTQKLSKKDTSLSVQVGYEQCLATDTTTACKFMATAFAQAKKDITRYQGQQNIPVFKENPADATPQQSYFSTWSWPVYTAIMNRRKNQTPIEPTTTINNDGPEKPSEQTLDGTQAKDVFNNDGQNIA